jgi:hypothetical protein
MTADQMGEIERRRLRALVEADVTTAAELHADDYELITPLGVALSKNQYLGAIGRGQLKYARFEPVSEIAVRLGAEFAVLRYQAAIALAIALGPAGDRRGFSREHRDAPTWMHALLDPAGEPAAVNCRQRHATHHRRTAFALVRGALGGTRTPNLLIRRCGPPSGRKRFRWSFDASTSANTPGSTDWRPCCRQRLPSTSDVQQRAPSFGTDPWRSIGLPAAVKQV